MTKLSVTIITKNEEKNMQACLTSVAWVDEIIIVDSFSEDRTVEIGRKFTDKIFLKKFVNYSEQRNFANDKASNPWVLALDVDERITTELKEEIIKTGCISKKLVTCDRCLCRGSMKQHVLQIKD